MNSYTIDAECLQAAHRKFSRDNPFASDSCSSSSATLLWAALPSLDNVSTLIAGLPRPKLAGKDTEAHFLPGSQHTNS